MASSYTSRIPQIMRDFERDAEAATQRAAGNVADRARPNVPRDTGRTASTVDAHPAPDGDGYEVTVDFPGLLLEFGTAKMGARPFLVPAAEAERVEFVRAVRGALDT